MKQSRFLTRSGHELRVLLRSSIPVLAAFLLASCSLLPASLFSARQNETPEQTEDLQIPVIRGTIDNSISFVGNLQYSQSSALTWKTDGVIDKVYVKVGDHVKKNDILAELAPDSLSSSILLSEKTMIEQQEKLEDVMASGSDRMQAYVNLNSKETALKNAKLAQEALYYPRATREEMEIAWDKFALANLNFNYAKQDYDYLVSINETWEGYEPERWQGNRRIFGGDSRSGRERKFEDYVRTYNDLVDAYENYVWISGMPSDIEYAVAQGNVAVAQMEYDKALEEWLSYNNLPRDKDVQAVQRSLDSAEAVYKSRYILAPFDGTVTSVSAVGSYYVKRGDAAVRVDDMSKIYIPLSISELDIGSLSNGTPASIVVDANYGKTYSGRVYSVAESSTASGNTSSFNAMVLVDDPDDSLLAGMTAEVTMRINTRTDVLLIPDTAITYSEEGKPCVRIVKEPVRYTVEITTGSESNGITEVTSGNLSEGDLLSVPSVTEEVLKALGLDPSAYLSTGNRIPGSFTPGSFPTGTPANFPGERPDSIPGRVPEMPAVTADTAAEPAGPEKTGTAASDTPEPAEENSAAAGPAKPAENEAAASDTPVPAEITGTPDSGTAGRPFPGRNGPEGKPDGQFPNMPENEQLPETDGRPQHGSRPRPGSEGEGSFRGSPSGERPDLTVTPTVTATAAPAAGNEQQENEN